MSLEPQSAQYKSPVRRLGAFYRLRGAGQSHRKTYAAAVVQTFLPLIGGTDVERGLFSTGKYAILVADKPDVLEVC